MGVKFFSSDMVGAPVLSGTKGTMISVLDACLVDGFALQVVTSVTVASNVATVVCSSGNFVKNQVLLVSGATPSGLNGEKRVVAITGANTFTFDATGVVDGVATGVISVKVAPLGWTKPFSGTNEAAYQTGANSTGVLIKFSDTGSYGATVAGYESMSDISTGVGKFPTTTLAITRASNTNSTLRKWFIVGDEKIAYIGTRVSDDPNMSNWGFTWSCFGEFKSNKSTDLFNYVISATNDNAESVAYGATSNVAGTSNTSYIHVARSHAGIGGSKLIAVNTWPSKYGVSGSGSIPYPNPADYGLYLCKAQLFEPYNAYRGDFPGMYLIPQYLYNQICVNSVTPYYDTEVAGFEGKLVAFLSSSNASNWGVVAFDLTGPWEH